MSDATVAEPHVLTRLTTVSIIAIVAGAALFFVSVVADWEGFWGGMGSGAGIALTAMGAYFWGYANGLRRAGRRAVWLPSSDTHE